MTTRLTCAIGDVHGCYGQLRRLLGHCARRFGDGDVRYVFLGDYVDRGPHSRDVVAHLIGEQRKAPDRIVCLRGNHEDMLLAAARRGHSMDWMLNGGATTLDSYNVAHVTELPTDHIAWFKQLRLSFDDGKRFFVHAGIVPGVPLDRQSEEAMLWIRERFLSDARDHGRYIVHGHTPVADGRPELARNRLNLDTGACFGGPLTAAVFDNVRIGPVAFITDEGRAADAPDVCAGRADAPIAD